MNPAETPAGTGKTAVNPAGTGTGELPSRNGRWLRLERPPQRSEAIEQAARRAAESGPADPDRPPTMAEELDRCRAVLRDVCRRLGLALDPEAFGQDAALVFNRARGYGFLAELLPPASHDWSDLGVNPDGSV